MGGGNRGERDQDVPLLVLRLNTSLDADAVLATATKGTSQHSDRYCILSWYELFLQEPNLRQICAFVLQRSHTTRLVSLFCLQHSFGASFLRCFLRRSAHRLEVVADAQPLDRRPLLAEGALGDLEQPRALLERLRHSFVPCACRPVCTSCTTSTSKSIPAKKAATMVSQACYRTQRPVSQDNTGGLHKGRSLGANTTTPIPHKSDNPDSGTVDTRDQCRPARLTSSSSKLDMWIAVRWLIRTFAVYRGICLPSPRFPRARDYQRKHALSAFNRPAHKVFQGNVEHKARCTARLQLTDR